MRVSSQRGGDVIKEDVDASPVRPTPAESNRGASGPTPPGIIQYNPVDKLCDLTRQVARQPDDGGYCSGISGVACFVVIEFGSTDATRRERLSPCGQKVCQHQEQSQPKDRPVGRAWPCLNFGIHGL
ncbi:hypothetical protein MRX96_016403 [Rhipicephalus microplus]